MVDMDTDGAYHSVLINRVSILSGFLEEIIKNVPDTCFIDMIRWKQIFSWENIA